MSGIALLKDSNIKDQNDFLIDTYRNFIFNAVYGFLFEGLQLRDIELRYLGKEQRGFFSKAVLNMIGIDTSKESKNRGIFSGRNIDEVCVFLMSENDPLINNIGRILSRKRSL